MESPPTPRVIMQQRWPWQHGCVGASAHQLCPRLPRLSPQNQPPLTTCIASSRPGKILPANDPRTIADGLRTSLGELTFATMQQHVQQIVTVSEEAIVSAMRYVWERMKIVIEPSAAVPIGALLEKKIDLTGKRVGVILSGGNVALDQLPWMS